MTHTLPARRAVGAAEPSGGPTRGAAGVLLGLGTLGLVLASVHLTQGTSGVGLDDLPAAVTGADQGARDVLLASRLPRLLAAVTVGLALGASGAALQSVARNPLASPDTLAVNAGAHLAVVTVAAFGLALPLYAAGLVAFVGGLLAAGLVLALATGGAAGPTRLILAGAATMLALNSLTMLQLLLFEQETTGLFAWGEGSLSQTGLSAATRMLPVVLVAALAMLLLARRLDVLALGDDAASSLGVGVRRLRVGTVVLAVLLAAAAVTLAGPIGFVGLCAPVAVRLAGRFVPGLLRHALLVPASALTGVVVLLAADVLVRGSLGETAALRVPTGVATTIVGALVLVALARRSRDSGPARTPPAARPRTTGGRLRTVVVLSLLTALVLGSGLAGMLLGDTAVLLGDLQNWLAGRTGAAYTFVLDQRLPRVLAAVLAGAALGVAGTAVQAVCRNPLAEPGLLGISAGAGLGAVVLATAVPAAGVAALTGSAGLGGLATFALVYGLSWRGGLSSDRLVLVGIGTAAAASAVTTLVIVVSDPWNTAKALTWLSGSTYGRTLEQVVPVAAALVLLTPVLARSRRELDLTALDDDTPRLLGVPLEPTRLVVLAAAAVLTATAVTAAGVVGFVGLVAPHLARGLVGGLHARVLPAAALLGALLLGVADTVGRTVIAPAQVPAGLVTALVGAPYFVWLLWRSREVAR